MPLPRAVALANRYLTNPLLRPLAGRVPPFVLVEHRGRSSGKPFRTPVFAFAEGRDGDLLVALTYGPDVDWLKNLRAAGGGTVVVRGRSHRIGQPTVHHGLGQNRAFPLPVRALLGRTDIAQFARLPRRPAADAT